MWGNFAQVPVPTTLPCCGHNWQSCRGCEQGYPHPAQFLGFRLSMSEAQLSHGRASASDRAEGYQGIEAEAGEGKMRVRTGTAEEGPC